VPIAEASNLALEPGALAFQRHSPCIERSDALRLADSDGAPPHYGERDEHERAQGKTH